MSLYRKYRPQIFRDVVGQEPIVTTLKNGLRDKRIAHAYLFCGSRGTGKTTLARLLAKALNCAAPQETEPCGKCPSCHDIALGTSLDVLEIDGASNRGIDDIRALNETIHYVPSAGKYKIYIIDEVHMLTKEAFNALLKTLEEPPEYVKFFFATTEPHKVPPTILSRCQRFDLSRISLDAMVGQLSHVALDLNVVYEEGALHTIASFADGSLRDALCLLEQLCSYTQEITLKKTEEVLGLLPSSHFFALDRAVSSQDYTYPFTLAQYLFASGKDLSHFLNKLTGHFRNHLHLKYGIALPWLSKEEREEYENTSPKYSEGQCLTILEYLIDWEQKMRQVALSQTSLEMILLYILKSRYKITLSSLVQRLIALEKGNSEEKVQSPQVETPPPLKKLTPEIKTPELQPLPKTSPEIVTPVAQTPEAKITTTDSHPARYDTLIRFAAVELEGVIKK